LDDSGPFFIEILPGSTIDAEEIGLN